MHVYMMIPYPSNPFKKVVLQISIEIVSIIGYLVRIFPQTKKRDSGPSPCGPLEAKILS